MFKNICFFYREYSRAISKNIPKRLKCEFVSRFVAATMEHSWLKQPGMKSGQDKIGKCVFQNVVHRIANIIL
jgi:hypothetical protein